MEMYGETDKEPLQQENLQRRSPQNSEREKREKTRTLAHESMSKKSEQQASM